MRWYMTDGAAWLTAPDVKGPWKSEPTPPASVLLVMSIQGAGSSSGELAEDDQPEIVVATEPTEVLAVARSDFEHMLKVAPGVGRALDRRGRKISKAGAD